MRSFVSNIASRTWRNINADIGSNIGTILAVGLAISIPLIFSLLAINMGRLVDTFVGQVEMVAYLSDDASDELIQQTVEHIRGMTAVESVTLVDKDEALQRFRHDLPELAELANELENNPLPASVEIRLQARYRDLPAMEEIAQTVLSLAGVIDVDYGRQWAEKLGRVIRYIWLGTFVMGLFLAVAAGLLVANTIRLSIVRRREEISIFRLVGASNTFIRIPLLIEGIIQGVMGGLIGLGLCYAIYWLGRYQLVTRNEITDWLMGGIDLVWFLPPVIGLVIVLGGLVGLVASIITTGRYMRV